MRPPHIVAVHAFFCNEGGEVLLIKRAGTGYMDGWYGIPAGHVEELEFASESLTREIQEEVGVILKNHQTPVHVMHRLKMNDFRIDYFYLIREWEGKLQNCEPDKCSELVWVPSENLGDHVIPYIQFAWEKILEGEKFSEFTEPEVE